MPRPFYHLNFSSDPGAAPRGGDGAEQFDRRITPSLKPLLSRNQGPYDAIIFDNYRRYLNEWMLLKFI